MRHQHSNTTYRHLYENQPTTCKADINALRIDKRNMGLASSAESNRRSSCSVKTQELLVTNEEDGFEIVSKLWTGGDAMATKARAAAVFLHGGIFSRNDRNSHAPVSEALVRDCGLSVLTADFRDGSSTTFRSGKTLSDLKALVRFMKSKYPKLPFGVIGSSSGGYFALQLRNALQSGDIHFCIPLAPVADPKARALYLRDCIDGSTPISDSYLVRHTAERAQFMLDHQLKYFESFQQMSIATEQVVKNKHGIPTLLVLGGADKNIPFQVTQNVQQEWATRTIILGGIGHELQNEPSASPAHNYVSDINRFLEVLLDEKNEANQRH